MPPRLDALMHCWSTFDLPVLPCLAPRIFQPSIFGGRGVHWKPLRPSAQTTTKLKSTRPVDHAYQKNPIPRYGTRLTHPEAENSQQNEQDLVNSTRSNIASSGHSHHGHKDKETFDLRQSHVKIEGCVVEDRALVDLAMSDATWQQHNQLRNNDGHEDLVSTGNLDSASLDHVPCHDGNRTSTDIAQDLHISLGAADVISSASNLRKFWTCLEKGYKRPMWQSFMATTCEHWPGQALQVLEHTLKDVIPLADSLSRLLAHIILYEYNRPHSLSGKPTNLPKFVKRLRAILYMQAKTRERVRLRQSAVYRLITLLASRAEYTSVMQLYTTLKHIENPLHFHTRLHFASALASCGTSGVLAALDVMNAVGNVQAQPKVLSVFTTMLNREDRDADARILDSTILKFMMDKGLSPNIIIYTSLMHNAMRDGEFETGWNIYEMMIENNVVPSPITYSVLLHDAKVRMDLDAIKRITEIVNSKDIRHDHIITDVLHIIFRIDQDEQKKHLAGSVYSDQTNERAFFRMLRVFAEYYHLWPLIRIIPGLKDIMPEDLKSKATSIHMAHLPDPPVPPLIVMISAYLAGLQGSAQVKQFYAHIMRLIEFGDLMAVAIAGEPHFWSVIILEFGRFDDLLHECPEIVETMLSSTPSLAELDVTGDLPGNGTNVDAWEDGITADLASPLSIINDQEMVETAPPDRILGREMLDVRAPDATLPENQHTNPVDRKYGTTPNVYTWSVLLRIFMRHQQSLAAEKTLEVMETRGIKLNLIVWNTLIAGYANMQSPLDAADAFRRMEEAGFEPDGHTMKALARLHDKRTLTKAMASYEELKLQAAMANGARPEVQLFDDDELTRIWEKNGGPEQFIRASKKEEEDELLANEMNKAGEASTPDQGVQDGDYDGSAA